MRLHGFRVSEAIRQPLVSSLTRLGLEFRRRRFSIPNANRRGLRSHVPLAPGDVQSRHQKFPELLSLV